LILLLGGEDGLLLLQLLNGGVGVKFWADQAIIIDCRISAPAQQIKVGAESGFCRRVDPTLRRPHLAVRRIRYCQEAEARAYACQTY
jgi:hypothetical protein